MIEVVVNILLGLLLLLVGRLPVHLLLLLVVLLLLGVHLRMIVAVVVVAMHIVRIMMARWMHASGWTGSYSVTAVPHH